jgi:ABC-type transport system involved in multi-copper enzyme maturation permease subunit
MQILKYEMKKIFINKSAIISLIGLTIFTVFLLCFSISDATYVNKDGSNIEGIQAIKLLKSQKMKWNGYLTEDMIKKVLEQNRSINDEPQYADISDQDIQLSNMRYAQKQGFQDIRDSINNHYGEFRSYDYYLIDGLKPNVADKFDSNRINQLKTWLSSEDANSLTQKEKHYLITAAETLYTPLKYSYADGWQTALENSSKLLFALFFVVSILMAPVFSVEYQNGTDAILLSTEHGRKKGIRHKMIAGILSISMVYWVATILLYGVIFILFGYEGWDSPIQAYFSGYKSFYSITNIQAFISVVLLGYVACLFVGCLAMFLSAKAKSSFATIIFIVLVIIAPATISEFLEAGSLASKILSLFPDQMLNGWLLLRTFTFYDIGNHILTPYQILPVVYGALTIVLLPFTYQIFRKHQIK